MTDTKTVRLIKAHPHGPVKHPPGTELTLPIRLANWLIGQNIAVDKAVAPTATRAAPLPALLHRPCCGRK